jgi:hypothetical protein
MAADRLVKMTDALAPGPSSRPHVRASAAPDARPTPIFCDVRGNDRIGFRTVVEAGTNNDNHTASAGSQLQIQIYVNRRTSDLDKEICNNVEGLVGATLTWRSPVASERYCEYWDRSFLDAVGQGDHWPALNRFWPRGGPHWDALAVVAREDHPAGVPLIEAKATSVSY